VMVCWQQSGARQTQTNNCLASSPTPVSPTHEYSGLDVDSVTSVSPPSHHRFSIVLVDYIYLFQGFHSTPSQRSCSCSCSRSHPHFHRPCQTARAPSSLNIDPCDQKKRVHFCQRESTEARDPPATIERPVVRRRSKEIEKGEGCER